MEETTKEKLKELNLEKEKGGEKTEFDWEHIMELVIDDCVFRQGYDISLRNHMSSGFKKLRKFFKEKKIDNPQKINSKTAYEFSAFLANDKYYSTTRTQYLDYYKKLIKYLYANNYIKKDFEKTIPKLKYEGRKNDSKIWTDEELDKIIDAIKENEKNQEICKREIAMLAYMREYGLRISDVIDLKFENLNWKEKKLKIVQKKTNVVLELPLTDRVIKTTNDYLDNGRHPSKQPFIFLSTRHDKPIAESDFYTRFKTYAELANIEIKENLHHGSHSIRHTFATKLLKNGTPIPMIAAILGHQSISPTSLYINIDTEQLRECCLSLEVLNYENSKI